MFTYKKLLTGFTIFGILVFGYSFWEMFQGTYEQSQALLFMFQALLGIALIYAPELIEKLIKIRFPKTTIYFYWFFLLISVFLGTVLHLIEIVSFWDKILHTVSPMVLTAVGYGITCMVLKDTAPKEVSIWLFLLMGFSFAGICGVFWEFWEFLCDSVANMNLQRYATLDGTPFVGRAALMDTMGDLFTNTLGAFLMGVFAFVQSKGKANYFENYRIEKITNKK